ncbi:unnamed protein product [Acanthoscelides obtectus]|uniref:Uncharacterized protein n=1 Tax=Acanthoscelides obtectus TaxID=200917 RepID=A0A9P0PFX1_ACAOB|nr:unnamed protein product [Acanthoscelides obtectus]CAK1651226.1 hypothetical protein AOBTE_LOCUS17125 [Acanthoscelides obtectus]
MALNRLAVFFLVALSAATVQGAAYPKEHFETQSLQKNDIHELLENLRRAIQGAIDAGEKLIGKSIEALQKLGETILAGIMAAAEKAVNKIVSEIIEIQEKAIKAGLNIEHCMINETIATLKGLPRVAFEEAEKCVFGFIKQGKDYADAGIQKIKHTLDEITIIGDEIGKCGNDLAAIPCLAKLSIRIGVDIVQIPLAIADQAAKTVALIEGLKLQIPKCATDALIRVGVESGKLLLNVTKCVADAKK